MKTVNRRIRTKRWLWALIPLGIASCTPQLRYYEPPSAGPTASLQIDNAAATDLVVQLFEDSSECRKPSYVSAQDGGSTKVGLSKGVSRRIAIPASAPLTFAARMFESGVVQTSEQIYTSTSQCMIVTTFTPVEGRSYQAEWSVVDGQCQLSLIDEKAFAEGDAAKANVRVTPRAGKTPTTEGGAWCEPS